MLLVVKNLKYFAIRVKIKLPLSTQLAKAEQPPWFLEQGEFGWCGWQVEPTSKKPGWHWQRLVPCKRLSVSIRVRSQ